MVRLADFETSFANIRGTKVEVASKGDGRPLLFLHPGQGFVGAGTALQKLARLGRVVAPFHPGFGGSELPAAMTTVDDLAYFYLDLIDGLGLRDAVIIGASFGGWLAAEIAVRCSHGFRELILVDALGIKIGSREQRDIADMHAVDDNELASLLYEDPVQHRPIYAALSDEDALTIARSNEALVLFAWRPYMHNPKLLGRLHRIAVPTLVLWGAGDRVVDTGYGRAFSAAIPGARFETIDNAGHLSFVEQPAAFVARIESFLREAAH
jgi:pimeloyl-ACP methyl ester carboxylesterase